MRAHLVSVIYALLWIVVLAGIHSFISDPGVADAASMPVSVE